MSRRAILPGPLPATLPTRALKPCFLVEWHLVTRFLAITARRYFPAVVEEMEAVLALDVYDMVGWCRLTLSNPS